MPTLDLPPLHLPEAGVYLAAVMYFPREPDRHATLLQAAHNEAVRRVLTKNTDKEVSHDATPFIRQAVTGPNLKEVVSANPIDLISLGYNIIRPDVAHMIFIYVLACLYANDPTEPATLEHARKMIGSAGGNYASLPGLGRSQVIEVWRDFSPVVHLLAAKAVLHTLWNNSSRRGAGGRLAGILAYAEALRLRGEAHKPPRSQTPLLDPNETWKVPDWVALPPLPDGLAFPTPAMLRSEMAKWPGKWPRP